MTYDISSFLVLVLLQIQLLTSQNIYCEEAVNSVEGVASCPTSKTEWDIAALRKNCSGTASLQHCTNTIEKFQYHCVINGLRNKLVEVCAPTRIIFGYCVEFNVHGGVIQDQRSAPCNRTFPKCDDIYLSSDAYKYPDCYELVSISKDGSSTKTEPTSTIRTTTNEPLFLKPIAIAVSILLFVLISIAVVFVQFRNRRKSTRNKIDEGRKAMLNEDDYNQEKHDMNSIFKRCLSMAEFSINHHTREMIKIKKEEELKAELNSQKHNMNSIFKRCLSMAEFSTNLCSYKIWKHSDDTFLKPSVKDFGTRWRGYEHRRNCSA